MFVFQTPAPQCPAASRCGHAASTGGDHHHGPARPHGGHDAIVVVENVERLMEEEGLSPRDATRKLVDQITGASVGVALVLSAVFLPMAFFGGSTGVIYRQ
jgi:hypothetical protein